MILRLCLNEVMLRSGEHELSLLQRQPDGPGRIFLDRRPTANLVNADGPTRPGHLHHHPPLHPDPRFPDEADRSTPSFWTVSCYNLGTALVVTSGTSLLPWGAGDWLASSLIGGGRWQAGETLMERVSPESLGRMVRLYNACGQQPVESCEGAITARTATQPGETPTEKPGAARLQSRTGR